MRKLLILMTLLLLLTSCASGKKGHGFDVHFFGINSADFKDRKVLPVIIGGLVSGLVHETGHYVVGQALGMDTHPAWNGWPVIEADNWDNKSDNDRAMFSAGGFAFQAFVGSLLTAIPATRHSDFALGFTGFAMVENTMYGITGGLMDEEYSDVHNMNDNGWPGTEIALGSGLYSAVLTYINLNKVHDDESGVYHGYQRNEKSRVEHAGSQEGDR